MTNLPTLPHLLLLALWVTLWALGGFWLVRAAFRLRPAESLVAGLLLGLVAENLLANLLARLLPLGLSTWLAAALVLLAGLLAAARSRALALPLAGVWRPALLALVLFALAFQIGRGMPIHDDFAHLPTTSLIAAGYYPPPFALDRTQPYYYHSFLLLFGAQIMRLGGIFAWTALDLARALPFALAVLLAAAWARRLTGSRLAGFLGGLVAALGMGARWLLLLLPHGLLLRLDPAVQLAGSGQSTAGALAQALVSLWEANSGPVPFPFAFTNGIHQPGVLRLFAVTSLLPEAVFLVLLLTFNRWRSRPLAAALSVLLFASLGLLVEAELALLAAAWLLLAGWVWLRRRHLPSSLRLWLGVSGLGILLALVQGGALTGLLLERVAQGAPSAQAYKVSFSLAWPPNIVSQQLGVLSLLDPRGLLVALAEVGPVILALPLVAIWGCKALRAGRWFEAAYIGAGLLSLAMLLVNFTGNIGISNTSRLYDFVDISRLYFVPLVWLVVRRRSDLTRLTAAALGMLVVLGGFVMFAFDLFAIQKPVASHFITELDTRLSQQYFDALPADAMVFDFESSRSVTLFARPLRSSSSWYVQLPEWRALMDIPSPENLLAAGYRYVYLDKAIWEELTPERRAYFQQPCVALLAEVTDKRATDWRRLLDLSACAP